MSKPGFVVVIEGCDKCGKTSLANRLSSGLGWPVVKFSQPRGDAYEEYMRVLRDHRAPFIADRFHLGESVYGPLYRGTEPMDPVKLSVIEDALHDRGALLVLMEDDPRWVAKRFAALNEDFTRVADVYRVLHSFREGWRRSVLPKIRARWDESLPSAVADITRRMEANP